jgi:hypothetical protein
VILDRGGSRVALVGFCLFVCLAQFFGQVLQDLRFGFTFIVVPVEVQPLQISDAIVISITGRVPRTKLNRTNTGVERKMQFGDSLSRRDDRLERRCAIDNRLDSCEIPKPIQQRVAYWQLAKSRFPCVLSFLVADPNLINSTATEHHCVRVTDCRFG